MACLARLPYVHGKNPVVEVPPFLPNRNEQTMFGLSTNMERFLLKMGGKYRTTGEGTREKGRAFVWGR